MLNYPYMAIYKQSAVGLLSKETSPNFMENNISVSAGIIHSISPIS